MFLPRVRASGDRCPAVVVVECAVAHMCVASSTTEQAFKRLYGRLHKQTHRWLCHRCRVACGHALTYGLAPPPLTPLQRTYQTDASPY